MKALLLVRESPFQVYCANRLAEADIIDEVIVEAGISVPPERPAVRELMSRIRVELQEIARNPVRRSRAALMRLGNLVNRGRYYGERAFHERRLLTNYLAFDPRLKITRVDGVNAPAAVSLLVEAKPDAVFVHGTGLIGRHVLDAVEAPFVNLHWGWSPDYRGEGIVSALALEGPQALGVTVHLIDEGIDSGDILYRARPTLDRLDNFYAIGLKLTVLGTELMVRVAGDLERRDGGVPLKQVRQKSQLFSGRYLREHPELYPAAWRRLRHAVAG